MPRSPTSKSLSTYTPSHWPKDIQYLTAQQYNSSVKKDVLDIIRGQQPSESHQPLKPQPSFVVIRRIAGPIDHPASAFCAYKNDRRCPTQLQYKQAMGQFGLFAAKNIPSRTYLLDYLGEVHCDDRPSSDYDLSLYRSLDGLVSVGVDASAMGNEGRFVNDYRGIRAKPNAQFEERRIENGELRMSIWTGSKVIKKGEEILVSVGALECTPIFDRDRY